MADKDKLGSPSAQVRIGHYILGDTLGVGTFGKVSFLQNLPKDKNFALPLMGLLSHLLLLAGEGRCSSAYWSQSGCENYEQAENQDS